MTPAVTALDGLKLPYELLEYELSGSSDKDIGLAAARALGLPEAAVFKTLIAELADGALVVAVIPVAEKLNLKQLARACGVKSAKMADTRAAERATGYLTGGISPLGQKRSHRTLLADQANGLDLIYVSAGRRGLELALTPGALIEATAASVCTLTG